jgi:hypothetical protein
MLGARKGPLLTVIALALLVAALGGCGRVPSGQASAAHRSLVAADGQRLDAVEKPLSERPAISEAAARTQAAQVVTDVQAATAIQSRFVALTLETEKTTRNVWLVTYSGVAFTPNGCTCHVSGETPNTIVAVDGQTGAVVLLFGADDEQDAP